MHLVKIDGFTGHSLQGVLYCCMLACKCSTVLFARTSWCSFASQGSFRVVKLVSLSFVVEKIIIALLCRAELLLGESLLQS